MKLTHKGEYSIKALLILARSFGEKPLSIREISADGNIPYKFLEQIMSELRQAQFVKSIQGRFGGYSLSRSPKEIMLGSVIRTIEGPLAPIGNAEEIKEKIKNGVAEPGFYFTLLEVRDAISEILDHRSLTDVIEKSTDLSGSNEMFQMYHI